MSEQKQLSGLEALQTIGEIIQDIPVAMLTTVGPNGSLICRPMATQQPQAFDGRIWLLTRDESGTVSQIRQNSHVSLIFQENGSSNYLAVQGLANASNDRMKIQVLWNAMYKSQFPNGQGDPSIAVLTVDVTEAQAWEASANGITKGMRFLTTGSAAQTSLNAGQTGQIPVGQSGRAQQGRTIPVGQPANAATGKNANVPVEERTGELV